MRVIFYIALFAYAASDRGIFYSYLMFNSRFRRAPRHFSSSTALPEGGRPDPADARQGRCVALVDARFMGWLCDPGTEAEPGAMEPNPALLRRLKASMLQSGLNVDLLRVYWYSDLAVAQPVDDLVHRSVPDPAADGGQSTVRAMSADLSMLARHKAVEQVLLASDDERLWAAMDEAQLQGLAVHLLCDDGVTDFVRLKREDPSWARLLAQADRRVPWAVDGASAPVPVNGSLAALDRADRQARFEKSERVDADMQSQILAHIARWWGDEPEDQRHDLRDELQQARSIPQEVDRQLLLMLSRELAHPLSWPEKKIMREGVRRIVLGDSYTPYRHQTEDDPALES